MAKNIDDKIRDWDPAKMSDRTNISDVKSFCTHLAPSLDGPSAAQPIVSDGEELSSLGLPESVVKDLERECCPATSLYDEDDKITPHWVVPFHSVPPDLDLQTVNYYQRELGRRAQDMSYLLRSRIVSAYLPGDCPDLVHQKEIKLMSHLPHDISDEEILVTVIVYKSMKPVTTGGAMFVERELFHFLGSQPLSALRDVISCPVDHTKPGDYSDDPSVSINAPTLREINPSATFFFHNEFYDDTRHPACRSYGTELTKWAGDPKKFRGLPEYKVAGDMSVTFDQLCVRLGCVYLFLHQGTCEHTIVISDVRMIHKDDCQVSKAYPIRLFARNIRKMICIACHKAAVWRVVGSKLSPQDPAFYCDGCFKRLHCDENGQKLASLDFQAYMHADLFPTVGSVNRDTVFDSMV